MPRTTMSYEVPPTKYSKSTWWMSSGTKGNRSNQFLKVLLRSVPSSAQERGKNSVCGGLLAIGLSAVWHLLASLCHFLSSCHLRPIPTNGFPLMYSGWYALPCILSGWSRKNSRGG